MDPIRLIFLLFISCSPFLSKGQYVWELQNSTTSQSILSIDFLSDNIRGFAMGNAGAVLKTNNIGATWTLVSTIPVYASNSLSNRIVGVHYKDVDTLMAATHFGRILKSVDGGYNWIQMHAATPSNNVYDLCVSGNRVIISRVSDVLYSDDFGVTWDSSYVSGIPGSIFGISFQESGDYGFACGIGGSIVYSTDKGATWTPTVNSPTTYDLRDVAIINATTAVIVGEGGNMWRTTDAGSNWTNVSPGISQNMYRVDFANATHGVAVGAGNTVLTSSDGGVTWLASTSGANATTTFFAVDAQSATKAFIGADNGEIYVSPATQYTVQFLEYTGPDTTCFNRPFDYSFKFKNEGPGVAINPTFNVILGGYDLFNGTITYNGTVNPGATAEFIGTAINDNVPGTNFITMYAKIGAQIVGYFLQGDSIYFTDEVPYSVTGDQLFCDGDTLVIEATGGSAYYWPGAFSDQYSASQEVNPTADTYYPVEITQDYCTFFDTAYVFLDPNCIIDSLIDTTSFAPLGSYAFSPNNDGVNDYLVLDFLTDSSGNEVTIYNRWGDEIYHTNNYDNVEVYWNGNYNSISAPPGTYFFVANSNKYGVRKGWIQLVR